MKRTLIAVLVAAMIAVLLTAASAATKTGVVKPGEDFVYLDEANVLSEATKGEIYFANRELQKKDDAMIVIVALDSIGDADTYDYAYDLYNEWGIGGKDGNGLLLLMTVQEDDYYALAGEGLEGVFSSSVLKNLMDNELEPDFAKKDYDAGVRKFFEAAYARLAKYCGISATIDDAAAAYAEFAAENTESAPMNDGKDFADREARSEIPVRPASTQKSKGSGSLIWILLILVVILLICSRSKRRGGSFWFWRPTFFWPIFGSRATRTYRQAPRTPGPGRFAGPGPAAPGAFGGPASPGPASPRTSAPGGFTGTQGGLFGGTRGGIFGGTRSTGTVTRPATRPASRPASTPSVRTSTPSAGRSVSKPSGSVTRSFGGGRSGGFRSFGGGFSGGGGRTFGGGAGRGRH